MSASRAFVGTVDVVIGVSMLAFWAVAMVVRTLPGTRRPAAQLPFHIAAESVTGALLLAGGVGLLARGGDPWRLLSALGLGALLYGLVETAGHYVDAGAWLMVGVLALSGVLVAVTIAMALTSG